MALLGRGTQGRGIQCELAPGPPWACSFNVEAVLKLRCCLLLTLLANPVFSLNLVTSPSQAQESPWSLPASPVLAGSLGRGRDTELPCGRLLTISGRGSASTIPSPLPHPHLAFPSPPQKRLISMLSDHFCSSPVLSP